MKKNKEKRKSNIKKIIIVFTIILFGVLGYFWYRTLHITNIYVIGNNLLKERDILSETNLLDYPKIIQVSTKNIENKLIKNNLINKVNVYKSLLGKITIEIEENKVLYQKKNGKYVLSNNKEIELNEKVFGIPTMVNDCGDVCEKLNKKMLLIDKDILKHISEIEYKKTDLDKERFMFYMTDGNYVYITLSKINLINSYNEIYPTLDNKKGILYLDSGNHFVIKDTNDKKEIEIKEEASQNKETN